MARLPKGEHEDRENVLYRLLKRLRWGVRESEIAEELGWQRRTVNNYLRELKETDKAEGDAISFEVLNSLCKIFDAQVKDILEYIPDK